jgi:hypothetical protein
MWGCHGETKSTNKGTPRAVIFQPHSNNIIFPIPITSFIETAQVSARDSVQLILLVIFP